jgi:hypothetical protein
MIDIINAKQASRVIGCSPQMVRERIKRNIWTFGNVVTSKDTGRQLNSYEINIQKLADFLCISREEAERRLTA